MKVILLCLLFLGISTRYSGIDVSTWQKSIDWKTVAKNNHFANTTRETKQNFWRLNSYRTIRLRNQSTTNDSNILTNGKNTTSKKFNQIETNILKFNKCLFGVINNNNKNYSNAMNNETIKILPEEPRIQKLNSDIINYI